MKLEALLSCERTCYIDDPLSRKSLLERISQLICTGFPDLDSHEIFEAYLARERLGSTAIGHGVAIPHIRCQTLTSPRAAMIRVKDPIPFDDQDNRVDLIFALAVPELAHEEHLSLLGQLARALHPKENRQRLRILTKDSDLFNALCDCYDNPTE